MIFGVDICHGTEVHLDPIKVEFVGEGNRSKFAVKGGQKFTAERKHFRLCGHASRRDRRVLDFETVKISITAVRILCLSTSLC